MITPIVGVVVGRFQVDALTKGHMALLRHTEANSDKMIIFVGLRPTPANGTNPLPFDAVEMMLREKFPAATIVPIMDVGNTEAANVVWSDKLDAMIQMIAGSRKVIIFTGRDGFNRFYRGKFNVVEIESGCDDVNATEIRAQIASKVKPSRLWRQGVIYAQQNKQHHTYYAVDMACLRLTEDRRVEILLARKPNQMEWRFPGGFVEPNELFHVAAGREFFEETDLYTLDGFKIVRDFVVDDWRTKHQHGVSTKTVLCMGWYLHGTAKAKDDIAEVKWFDLVHVRHNAETLLVVEHRKDMMEVLWAHLMDKGIPTEVARRYA